MAIGLPWPTVYTEATVAEDGSLHLDRPAPALKHGEKVLLTISRVSQSIGEPSTSLHGTVVRYDDPFGPAAPPDEWETLSGC